MANATIINNELSSAVSGLRVDNPYMYIPYPDKPKPVTGGGLFFGIAGTDPELPQNQKRVYYIQEDGSILALSQPVPIGNGGVPTYNGAPAKLAVDGAYSFKVVDKVGTAAQSTVYYSAKTTHPALQQMGSSTIIEEIKTLADGQTEVEFDRADISQAVIDVNGLSTDSRNLIKDDDYTVGDGANGIMYLTRSFPAGTKIRARQNAFSNQTEGGVSSFPYIYDTVDIAKAEDLDIDVTVMCCGRSAYDDSLAFPMYKVVAGGTGVDDGLRFINMDNGNQLQAIDIQNRFSAYGEKIRSPSLTSGVLTIDVNLAPVHSIILTQSVTSIVFANAPTGQATTITLRAQQDGTGGRGINFSGLRAPGGTPPAVTSTANAQDFFVFTTFNGSVWYVFPAGNDFSVIP